jgi:hypothetical protein
MVEYLMVEYTSFEQQLDASPGPKRSSASDQSVDMPVVRGSNPHAENSLAGIGTMVGIDRPMVYRRR